MRHIYPSHKISNPLDRVCLCDIIFFSRKEQSFQLNSDDVIIVETTAAVVLREYGVET